MASHPRVLEHSTVIDTSDDLEQLSRDGLIRRIRQLSVLVLASGNRASSLKEQLQERERQVVELRTNLAILERTVKNKQDCIDCCLVEIDKLRELTRAQMISTI
jgi:septal ring factor EnvC (AmiA/AmiB activator)